MAAVTMAKTGDEMQEAMQLWKWQLNGKSLTMHNCSQSFTPPNGHGLGVQYSPFPICVLKLRVRKCISVSFKKDWLALHLPSC